MKNSIGENMSVCVWFEEGPRVWPLMQHTEGIQHTEKPPVPSALKCTHCSERPEGLYGRDTYVSPKAGLGVHTQPPS